jgi:hypothetical protein
LAGQKPGKIPQVMLVFAGLGVFMMVMGLVYTVVIAPSSQGNYWEYYSGLQLQQWDLYCLRKP